MSESGMRPRGSVEVDCTEPGCTWSFWIEALDPRLPDGPFVCPMHDGAAITNGPEECDDA